MTKVRAPLTFSLAIQTVAELIGLEKAAHITGRAENTVRRWGDSDNDGAPTLEQAIALDRAYIEAGGGFAPILECYARQLEVDLAGMAASPAALAEVIGAVSRETGEAVAHCIQALQPGASDAVIHRAIAETEQAGILYPRLIGWLQSLQRGNGAAHEAMGNSR